MSFHWHKWEIVASNIRIQPILVGGLHEDIGVPNTDILYKCSCGKVKEDSIHGRWTLEQLRSSGPSPQKERN